MPVEVTAAQAAALRERAMAALASVIDPESGLDIVAMGLVVAVDVTDDGSAQTGTAAVHVDLVMTSAACPMAGLIAEDAEAALLEAFGPDSSVEVNLVNEPHWHPGLMSAEARASMGWDDDGALGEDDIDAIVARHGDGPRGKRD
jgi:metal-sulfur cluster biosynthetic enzyme